MGFLKTRQGKAWKIQQLCFSPFQIYEDLGNNTFVLNNLDHYKQTRGPVNGRFLKHLFSYYKFVHFFHYKYWCGVLVQKK